MGYDLFIRLLNDAILEEQGKTPALPKTETVVDLRIDANLPERYIASPAARMEMYKKISLIAEEADRLDLLAELSDRYGKPPRAVLRLLDVALVRALGSRNGIVRVEQKGADLRFVLDGLNLPAWSVLFSERNDLKFNRTPPATVVCRTENGTDPIETARILLLRYAAVAAEESAGEEETKK